MGKQFPSSLGQSAAALADELQREAKRREPTPMDYQESQTGATLKLVKLAGWNDAAEYLRSL